MHRKEQDCNRGLNIETSMYVWSVACKSIVTYACHSMYLNNENLKDLDNLQGKLVKCIVGLSSRYRTTPLLQALKLQKISNVLELNTLQLFNTIFHSAVFSFSYFSFSHSAARSFYLFMYDKKCKRPKLLNVHASAVCDKYNLDYFKAMTSDVLVQTARGIHNIIPNNSDGLL